MSMMKLNQNTVILLGILLVVGFFLLNPISETASVGGGASDSTFVGEEVDTGISCALGESQKVTYHGVDFANPGTSVGSSTATLYKIENDGSFTPTKTGLADDTEQTTEALQSYALHVTKSGYFDVFVDFTTPCALDVSVPGINQADIDSSASIVFYDEDNLKNVLGSNELDFSENGTETLTLRIKGGETDGYVTSPEFQKVVVAFKYVDVTKIDTAETDMPDCVRTSIPQSLSDHHMAFICDNSVSDYAFQDYAYNLKSASGQTIANGTITVSVAPWDHYTSNEGYVENGVEDDDGTAVQTKISGSLYV